MITMRSLRPLAVATVLTLAVLTGMASAAAEEALVRPWPHDAPAPDLKLRDARGAYRTMRDFRGHVTLVTFGYTSCPAACPLELHKLAEVVRGLHQANAPLIVFVTLDPARDTTAVLKRYLHDIDPHFIGLRGNVEETNAAARSFSIEYARVPAGDSYMIDHPVEEFLFDRDGRLRYVGVGESTPQELSRVLTELIGEK